MARKQKHKSSSLSKNFKTITISLSILLAILIVVTLISAGIIENPLSLFEKKEIIEEFSIDDTCSLISGQLIHPIKNEDVCRQRCVIECEVRNSEYKNHTFIASENNCNLCNCNCI